VLADDALRERTQRAKNVIEQLLDDLASMFAGQPRALRYVDPESARVLTDAIRERLELGYVDRSDWGEWLEARTDEGLEEGKRFTVLLRVVCRSTTQHTPSGFKFEPHNEVWRIVLWFPPEADRIIGFRFERETH